MKGPASETWRMLWAMAKAYPGRSAFAFLLLVVAGFAEGIGLAAVLPLLNLAIGEGSSDTTLSRAIEGTFAALGLAPGVGGVLLIIAGFMLLKGLMTLGAMTNVGYTVAHVMTQLRLSLIRALMRARWDYFISQPVGRFANAIVSEAERAAAAYVVACKMAAFSVQITVYAVLALMISSTVMLAAVVMGMVVVVSLSRLIRNTRRAARQQTELQKSLLARLTDGLYGIKPLKAMAREDSLGPFLEGEARSLNVAVRRQVVSREAMIALQEPIIAVFLCAGIYGAIVYLQAPLESLAVMALLFQRTATRIGRLQSAYQRITEGESAYWSLQTSIEEADAAHESLPGRIAPSLERALSLEEVSFSYGDKQVLTNVSLTVPARSFATLSGPSGAGKTTLVDLIIGLHRPQSGRICLDGTPLSDVDLYGWRRTIGYVPQEMFLFHDTILANVTLADPELTEASAEDALRAAGAWTFVSELPKSVHTVVGERGATLSGGQRQRIAIARALVRRPQLLVLDEVTTSLDPKTETAICATLSTLARDITILAISHQQAFTELADVVYRIDNGTVKAVPQDAAVVAVR